MLMVRTLGFEGGLTKVIEYVLKRKIIKTVANSS